MTVLHILDCLCTQMLKVQSTQKYHEVVTDSETKPHVFVVLDEEENFLDLVEARHAALFPGRIFSDLLIRNRNEHVTPDTPLEVVLERFDKESCEFIAIVENNRFIGVISNLSLFMALVNQERQLRRERDDLITKLEAELNHRKLASLVFENTSEGILITDAEANIIEVNRGFCFTTGYTAEEVIHKTQYPAIRSSG